MNSLDVKILTLFPDAFPGMLAHSITGKALKNGLWNIEAINIRDYAKDKHKSVDDTPFGGGAGMVMKADVVADAIRANHKDGKIVYMSPRGKVFNQKMAEDMAKEKSITVLCGHYEGIDERILETFEIEEISMGDFVLSGGEVGAITMLDAIVRLVPGVVGKEESLVEESFSFGLLEYPQYTKPSVWEDKSVPEILLSGHHENIKKWRHEQAIAITKQRRPDLYEKFLNN